MSRFCVVQAPVGTMSGYGAHGRDLVRSLIKAYPDWEIKIKDTRWGSTPRNYLQTGRDDDIISRLINEALPKQPDIFFQVSVPNEMQPIGKWNCMITAGIETTLCAVQWLEGLNKANLNIVPSTHSKSVFMNSKYEMRNQTTQALQQVVACTKPIEVLFEGIDETVYKKTDIIEESITDVMKTVKEEFAFLFVGHWLQGELGHDRKDVGMTIKTFCETFKSMPIKPALVLKTSLAALSLKDREALLNRINTIRLDDSLPNIYLIHGSLTNKEMNSLYNHKKIKAMISFTHGEGYGRPLAEFAAVGKPIIAPKWSGHLDFLKEEYVTLLPGELKQVHASAVQKDMILANSKWFYVNYFYASRVLKDIYKNYRSYKKKASSMAEIINKYYTLNKMTERFKSILDKHLINIPEEVELTLPVLTKIKKDEKSEK